MMFSIFKTNIRFCVVSLIGCSTMGFIALLSLLQQMNYMQPASFSKTKRVRRYDKYLKLINAICL